jgi:hypothetical protein
MLAYPLPFISFVMTTITLNLFLDFRSARLKLYTMISFKPLSLWKSSPPSPSPSPHLNSTTTSYQSHHQHSTSSQHLQAPFRTPNNRFPPLLTKLSSPLRCAGYRLAVTTILCSNGVKGPPDAKSVSVRALYVHRWRVLGMWWKGLL